MYVQGVSTRKIKTITEELCGHEFSASAISEMHVKLDGELERFARRALEVEFPYLILDARYEQVREEGVIRSRAVLVVIGIDWEGRRQILAVEIANRESTTSWRDLLLSLPPPAQNRRRLPHRTTLALRPARRHRSPPAPRRLDRTLAGQTPQTHHLGRRPNRRNLHLLPLPADPSQTPQKHQPP